MSVLFVLCSVGSDNSPHFPYWYVFILFPGNDILVSVVVSIGLCVTVATCCLFVLRTHWTCFVSVGFCVFNVLQFACGCLFFLRLTQMIYVPLSFCLHMIIVFVCLCPNYLSFLFV